MKYNFDATPDRKTSNSIKWNPELVEKWCGFHHPDLLSYWVADMDFACAPAIREAVINAAREGIYGYSDFSADYYELVAQWFLRRYGCAIEPEWVLYSNGIVPALNYAVQQFCPQGGGVLIQPPVYYPFSQTAHNNGLQLFENKLLENDNSYLMDIDDLHKKIAVHAPSVMFLCNPHNPVGRVWKKEELVEVARVCVEHEIILVSDEIHADIVYAPNTFTSMLSFEFAYPNLIVCSSPSKTFNIAGLQISNIIIPDEKLRNQYKKALARNSVLLPNFFGIAAARAALKDCDDWLEEVLEYLAGNAAYIKEYIRKNIPQVKLSPIEGTFLAWIDMSAVGTHMQRARDLAQKAHVALDNGYVFGTTGESYERINFACSRKVLCDGLERISHYIKSIGE